MTQPRRPGSRLPRSRDFRWAGGLAVLSLAFSATAILRRPDLVRGAEFLFGDAGHNLLVADRLASGAVLYRDVFFPYGPLSAYVYSWCARALGNTPNVYLMLLAAISAANLALGFLLVSRLVRGAAAIIVTVALASLLVIPGAIAGAFTISPYLVLERTSLLLLALAWSPPPSRTAVRSAYVGVILGVWQGVKFGGAFVGGAAWVAVDALYLASRATTRHDVRVWASRLTLTAAAFVGVEAFWIAVAFATLPSSMALDAVVPLYMFQGYSVVTPAIRWPHWDGWRLAIGQYLLPLSAGVFGASGLLRWYRETDGRRSSLAPGAGGVALLLVFYLLGCLGYFHHIYHFQQFLWTLVPGAAVALVDTEPMVRVAALTAFAPGILLVARAVFVSASAPMIVTVQLPQGGAVSVNRAMADRLSALEPLAAGAHGAPFLVGPVASGWHYEFGVPTASRHSFFFAPELVRPYERQRFVDSLDRVAAVIACDGPATGLEAFHLSTDLQDEVAARFDYRETAGDCTVYRPRRDRPPATDRNPNH